MSAMLGSRTALAVDEGTDAAAAHMAPFDALYAASDDPWSTAHRWYEERRRALILASLPHRRYARAYEAGCGNGNLSEVLAERCDRLLASDGSEVAVRIARQRLAAHRHIEVALHRLPLEWPAASFDLVVLSELLYFLTDDDVEVMAKRSRESLAADGVVVACHWRAEIEGYGHSGDDTHRLFERSLNLPRLFDYEDDDFVLSGWSADARSVAVRDGVK